MDQEKRERTLQALHSTLSEEAFASAWEQGRAMTLDQAVIAALDAESADADDPIRDPEPLGRSAHR